MTRADEKCTVREELEMDEASGPTQTSLSIDVAHVRHVRLALGW